MNNEEGTENDSKANDSVSNHSSGSLGFFGILTACPHYKLKTADNQKDDQEDTDDRERILENKVDESPNCRKLSLDSTSTPSEMIADRNSKNGLHWLNYSVMVREELVFKLKGDYHLYMSAQHIDGCIENNSGIIRGICKCTRRIHIIKTTYFMVKTLQTLILLVLVGMAGLWVEARAAVRVPTSIPTASPSAALAPTQVPIVTAPDSQLKLTAEDVSRLEKVLDTQKIGNWNGINTFRKLERVAISKGVRADTIVLLLLLPLIATLVAVLHYILGLTGYGIFTPTMIAVALLATGIFGGLALFAMILAISLLANLALSKLRLHFWPARSINLLFISLGTFGLMIVSSYFRLVDITQISIFPVLFMIMLAEDFVRTQLAKSRSEAKRLMIGTLVLSIAGALVTSIRWVQGMVLLYPEVVILLTIIINVIVGSYTGIRLSELRRFKNAIREK